MRAWPVLCAVLAFAGCDGSPKARAGPEKGGAIAFPVEVAEIEARPVSLAVHAVGSVEAYETVQLTARVSGVVERVHFNEGQRVEAGQVLAEIEPERFRVKVRQAQSSLARARAARREARALLERRTAANRELPGLVTADELDEFEGRAALAEADVRSAQAQLDEASLNLRDAVVRAPLAGTIEQKAVRTGQFVQAGAPIGAMVQREPMLLRFRVRPEEARQIDEHAALTFRAGARRYSAIVVHVAEVAEGASRLVPVLARVDDPEREALRPGTFAEVTIPVGSARTLPVVPQTAVRASERGFLAYVVQDGVARERVVELGLRTDDGLVEVRNGLKPGEFLVVRGGEALREGAQVRVVERPAEPRSTGRPTRGRP